MKRYPRLGVVVIATHCAVAVWHLFLAAEVLPSPNNTISLLAVLLITLMHLAIAAAWWKLTDKLAGAILAIFFAVVLALDIYEHFLHPGANNVFMVLPGDWKTIFEVSVGLLLAIELLGTSIGILSLKGGRLDGLRVAS